MHDISILPRLSLWKRFYFYKEPSRQQMLESHEPTP